MHDDLCPGCGTPDPGRRRRGLGPACYAALLASGARVHFPVRDIPGRRFVLKVDMAGPLPPHDEVDGPCWLWTGSTNDKGYGLFRLSPDEVVYAHVWAAEQMYGPAPPGWQWDHRCHNRDHCNGGNGDLHRRCVNPAHLRLRTARDNVLDGTGPTADNARKTHCTRRGHPLSGDNVYTPPKRPRERHCVACRKEARQRATVAAQEAAAGVVRIHSRERAPDSLVSAQL